MVANLNMSITVLENAIILNRQQGRTSVLSGSFPWQPNFTSSRLFVADFVICRLENGTDLFQGCKFIFLSCCYAACCEDVTFSIIVLAIRGWATFRLPFQIWPHHHEWRGPVVSEEISQTEWRERLHLDPLRHSPRPGDNDGGRDGRRWVSGEVVDRDGDKFVRPRYCTWNDITFVRSLQIKCQEIQFP